MNTDQAVAAVCEALLRVAPEADLGELPPDAPLRDTLDLDSLDFLSFVEALTERTGCRIEEDDYPYLSTLAEAADFLAVHAPRTA